MVREAAWLACCAAGVCSLLNTQVRKCVCWPPLTCAAAGPQVAIKVLEHALILQDDISRETLLSTSIAHPGVVRAANRQAADLHWAPAAAWTSLDTARSQSLLHWHLSQAMLVPIGFFCGHAGHHLPHHDSPRERRAGPRPGRRGAGRLQGLCQRCGAAHIGPPSIAIQSCKYTRTARGQLCM